MVEFDPDLISKILWGFKYAQYRRKYDIHPSFRFNGAGTMLYGGGKITMGEGSYIGRRSILSVSDGTKLNIGRNCAISHEFYAYTANRVADQDMSIEKLEKATGDIIIGDDCWIGLRVYVREGVSIGQNSVIGANSVVIHDVEPNTIVAGSPAKIIKRKSYLNERRNDDV